MGDKLPPGSGQLVRRPDQTITQAPIPVAAGSVAGIVRARLVIVTGPDDGVFVYNGAQAAGNLIASVTSGEGYDASGNRYLTGITTYGKVGSTFYALQDIEGGLVWYTSASYAGPYGLGVASIGIDAVNDLNIGANENIVLTAGTGLAFQTTLDLIAAGFPYSKAAADGNSYDITRLTLNNNATGDQAITGTGYTPVTGLSGAGVAGVIYRLSGRVCWVQGTGTVTQQMQFQGSELASGTRVTVKSYPASGGTATQVYPEQVVNDTAFTLPAFAAGDLVITEFDGYLVFSAADTFGLLAAEGTGGDSWTIKAGSYLDLMPVTAASGGGGGGGGGGGPVTLTGLTVNGNVLFGGPSEYVTWLAPSGDTTGVTDSANLATALAESPEVIMTPGDFYWNTPALVGIQQTLAGSGPATRVHAVPAFSGAYMIQLADSASTYEVTVRDMYLICGQPTGSTLSGPGGILLDNTGWTGSTTTIIGDPLHHLYNVIVLNAGGDGFHFDNEVRELRIVNCKSYRSVGYGFYVGAGTGGAGCTDSHFTDCTSGFARSHGFYVAGANNMFTACKSFTSGFNFYAGTQGTTQCGFEITNALGAGNRNVFTGCSAQQATLHGFDLQSCDSVAITGCVSDSNGAGPSVTNGAGINLNAATNSTIIGNVGDEFLTPGAQAYGIQQAGVSTRTWIGMNSIYGTVTSFQYVSGSGYYLIDGQVTDFSEVTGQFRTGLIEMFPANLAALSNGSNVAPTAHFGTYPVSLAASVTGVTLSAALYGGQMFVLINTSGADTITFAAAGTSNVAGGTAVVIQPLQAVQFTWDANTSLWYPLI